MDNLLKNKYISANYYKQYGNKNDNAIEQIIKLKENGATINKFWINGIEQ